MFAASILKCSFDKWKLAVSLFFVVNLCSIVSKILDWFLKVF